MDGCGIGINNKMTAGFDVFLSHNSKDKPQVLAIAERLKARGLSVWVDAWELRPGQRWQGDLLAGIEKSKAVAVLIGADGLGPWQAPEKEVALNRALQDPSFPVIPALLPNAPSNPALDAFLQLYTWVDGRQGFTDEVLDRLYWGITGEHPELLGELPEAQPASESETQTAKRRQWPWNLDNRIAAGGLVIAALTLLVAMGQWLWPKPVDVSGASETKPEIYTLRVHAQSPQGESVAINSIRISTSHELQQLSDGGWEIEIPRAKLPDDHTVTLSIEAPPWASAQQQLTLNDQAKMSLQIPLQMAWTRLFGRVLDRHGNPLEQIIVAPVEAIDGLSLTHTQSDNQGRFELSIPESDNQKIRIRAESFHGAATEAYCYAGQYCEVELKTSH